MAYRRDHIVSFLTQLAVPAGQGEEIRKRMDVAIAQYSSTERGLFSSSSLGEVLGNQGLVDSFNDKWEKGELGS
jgi:hypothetical protein